MNEKNDSMKSKVERLVCIATGDSIREDDLRQAGGSLRDVGLDSIGFMNLLEALERSFGVVIDPEEDPDHLLSVDSIVEFLADQLGQPASRENAR